MVELARSVLKNSFYNGLSVIISKGGGVVFTVILARLLHPELFGTYHLALSVGLMFLTFTDLGINGTVIRYVSHAIGEDDRDSAASYFRYLLKIKFVFSLITTLVLVSLAGPLASHLFHKPELSLPLMIVGLFLFFQSFLDFIESGFVSMQRFEYSTIRHLIYEGSRLVIVPLFILLGFSVYGALAGLILSVVLAVIVLAWFFLRNYSFLLRGKAMKNDRKRKVLRFLGYLTLGSISGIFFAYVDSIMLGMFMPTEYVGFYRAGYNIVFAFVGLTSIAAVLFPVFAQLERDELEDAFRKVFKYTSIIAFPCAFGLIFSAEPLIKSVYGIEYMPAILPTCILSLLIVITPMDFFGTLFNAKDKPEYPAKLLIYSSIINIALNYVFILKFGVAGAAAATVISRYINAICLGLLSKKFLNIFPRLDAIYKPILSSAVMCLFLYLLPAPSTLLASAGMVAITSIIYLLTLYLVKGIEMEDIRYLSLVLGHEKKLSCLHNLTEGKLFRKR